MNFSFEITDRKKYCVISLAGSLIEKNQAAEMMDEINTLLAHDVNYFVLDLEDLMFMNSNGITILLGVLTKARKAGGDLVILNIPEKMISVFSFLKLSEVFTVVEHETDVLPMIV